MSNSAADSHKIGRFDGQSADEAEIVRPRDLMELRKILHHKSRYTSPFRAMGADTGATDCNRSMAGTIIDMTGLNEIIDIDLHALRVTVEAGVRLGQLAKALAAGGMELNGCHDLARRTVGGAIAGVCSGPAIGSEHGLFASQVVSMKVVAPQGEILNVDDKQKSLLNIFRLSYGMLGVIYEVVLKIRRISRFSATQRRCSFEQLSSAVNTLVDAKIGMRFLMLPFSDTVYLDLRRTDRHPRTIANLPWKIKDWSEGIVLPRIVSSLNRIIPLPVVRYRLIDNIHGLTQQLVNNRLVSSGSVATVQSFGTGAARPRRFCTWYFPAAEFSVVIQAYKEFCFRVREEYGFRCDMPTVGYRLSRDRSAILSPSYDEPMIALRAESMQASGWGDFAIDFGEFARQCGASPAFNQTPEVDPAYAKEIFQQRLEFFRGARQRIDASQRMMNPFLARYFC